jgi:hypothetical protein
VRGEQVVAQCERAEAAAARLERLGRDGVADAAEAIRALSAALLELVRESQEGPAAHHLEDSVSTRSVGVVPPQ